MTNPQLTGEAMNSDDIAQMLMNLTPTTKAVITGLSKQLVEVITEINKSGCSREAIVPPPAYIFEALRLCPLETARVVVCGQDPYPNPGEAHGLAFSCKKGIPASLGKIYENLQIHCSPISDSLDGEVQVIEPSTGDLTHWAQQDVLLLNIALTTETGKSGAHMFWSKFTNELIKQLPNRIFILLGAKAQSLAPYIPKSCKILTAGHPSPLNPSNRTDNPLNFKYATVFADANMYLRQIGQREIRWLSCDEETVDPQITPVLTPVLTPIPPPAVTSTQSFTYYMYTDGGAIGNGKDTCQASWGYALCLNDKSDLKILNKDSGRVTPVNGIAQSNNRAELTAFQRGIMWFADSGLDATGGQLIIMSDSKYSLNCVGSWYQGWKQDPKKMARMKNIDLISDIYNRANALKSKVIYKHVAAHQDEPPRQSQTWLSWNMNDLVDDMCNVALGRQSHRRSKNDS